MPLAPQSPGYRLLERGLQVLTLGLVVAAPLVAEGSAEQFSNWMIFLLWLVACAGYAGLALLRREERLKAGAVDFCVYGVCLWAMVSGLVSFLNATGHARTTINATWQWLGYAAAFFVIRQLGRQRVFRTVLIWGLLSISAGVAVAGLYQRFVIFPALQRAYHNQTEEQKAAAMRQGGINNVEPGSRERIMWENRLNATDSTATFVLANSLAAFLSPWLIVMLSLLPKAVRSKAWGTLAFYAILVVVTLTCLVLTNSRTSLLATLMGVVALALVMFSGRGTQKIMKWVVAVLIGLSIVLGLMVISGGLNAEKMGAANQSLLYRIEYWQASGQLIRDHFWFGCGPGNFQHSYSLYQLPQASETVSDPHNFLVEVWAVAGTPAAILLIAGIILWCLRMLRSNPAGNQPADESSGRLQMGSAGVPTKGGVGADLPLGIGVAGFLGLVSAVLSQTSVELVAIAFAVALIAGFVISFMSTAPESDRSLTNFQSSTLAIALATFGIALSASGGIGFPSVAMTGIVLLALSITNGLESSKVQEKKNHSLRGNSPVTAGAFNASVPLIGVLLLSVIAMFGFRATVYDPIQAAQQHLRLAEMEATNGRLQQALDRIDLAIQADPYDGNFHFFKLQMAVGKFQFQPASENWLEIETLAEKSVTSRPNNSKVALESGKLILGLLHSSRQFSQDRTERIGQLANWLFQKAAERRPNDGLHAAYLAYSYAKTGQNEKAVRWADRALELDELNPHRDKALSNGPFRLPGHQSPRSVEQELNAIRKN